jgi:hypothetical protein
MYVKCPIILFDFNRTVIFVTDFYKVSYHKFHGNPFNVSSSDLCAGRTDIMKVHVIGSFCGYASASYYLPRRGTVQNTSGVLSYLTVIE